MATSTGLAEAWEGLRAAAPDVPEADRDTGRPYFAAGWDQALLDVERTAVHWEACGLNETGRAAVRALRAAVAAARRGWECTEAGHPPACHPPWRRPPEGTPGA